MEGDPVGATVACACSTTPHRTSKAPIRIVMTGKSLSNSFSCQKRLPLFQIFFAGHRPSAPYTHAKKKATHSIDNKMSVFDRLTDQNRYTGVYKERMSGDGRINAQTGNNTAQGKAFVAVQHSGRSRRLSELGRSIFAQHSSGDQVRHTQAKSDRSLCACAFLLRPFCRTIALTHGCHDCPVFIFVSQAGAAARGRGGGGGQAAAAQKPTSQMNTTEMLMFIFSYYCKFGRTGGHGADEQTLDSFNYMKFVKSCPRLLCKRVTRTDADIIFTKAKPKFERRLDFPHFLDALAAISAKRYPDLDPTTAFKTTLGKHVFQCPLARGEVHTEHLAAAQGHDKRKIGRFAGSATDGEFRGNTNTGTDQNIHDISTTFRTNLRVNQGRGRMHF